MIRRLLLLSHMAVAFGLLLAPSVQAQTGTISGKVTRVRDGAAVAGAALTARPSEGGKALQATSGADGGYRFSKLADGYWRVTASAPGLLSESVERLEVRAGETATAHLALRRGGALTGRVVDEAGAPIAGAEIEMPSGNETRKVKTDADGRYRMADVPPDEERKLRATARGYVQAWSDAVTVADEAAAEVPALRLETGATLTGRVIDSESGKPLAAVNVHAYGSDAAGSSYGTGKADAQGRYSIEGLRSGVHTLSAHREGYEYWSGGDVAAVKGEASTVRDVALVLRPASFSIYSNQKVFAPGKKPKIYFNAFRTKSFSASVRALDADAAFAAGAFAADPSGGEPGSRRAPDDFAGPAVATVPRQTISYQRVLADVHGRGLTLLALPSGFYVVEAKADNGLVDSTWIQVTDLALVSKETFDELVIYAADLVTSKARGDVELRLDVAGPPLAKTDESGVARLTKTGGHSFAPLLARDPATGATALLNAGGYWPPPEPETWRVYLETDRPIYRPAQTVFYKGTVRADRDGAYTVERPASALLTIADPEGTVLSESGVELSAAGTFDGSIELEPEAALGFYSMQLAINVPLDEEQATGDGISLHGGSFRVEEYRKPEFKVDAALDRPWVVGGSADLTATFDASYYFGGPVAGARISYSVYSSPFYPWSLFENEEECVDCWTGWDDSGFEEQGFGRLLSFGDVTTDANGRAVVAIATRRPRSRDERYRVVGRVEDPTGRQVEDSAAAIVSRAAFALQVSTERYVVAPDETLQVDVRAADFSGEPVATPFTLRVLEEKWSNGKSSTTLVQEVAGATGTAGKARLAVRPGRAGHLKLYALARDGAGRLTDESSWVWSAGEGWALAEAPRSALEIVTDKKTYRPGETARVLVNSSTSDLDVLFTIEGERVREARRLRLKGASTLFELPIGAESAPTLHLGATAVSQARLLQTGRSIPVSPERKLLTVVVRPEKEIYRPRERAAFTVETRDSSGDGVSAEVSLAVVDEAIFALSRELVPDIRAAFWGPRPNRVRTGHSFPHFYEGGADKFDASERRRVFKDTALWEAYVRTDAQGRARVEFELPDNLTTWRATARAATLDTSVGEDRSTTVARKDLMVRLAPPRFFVSGDQARLVAVVHNETDRPQRVSTRAQFEGLAPLGPLESAIDLAPKSVGRLELPVRALVPGTARLVFDATSGEGDRLSDGVELTVPVLPYGASVLDTKAGSTTASTAVELHLAAGADPASSRLTVHLFPSLAGGLLDALRYLDTYPYGCVEQTLNAFVPAAIVRQAFERLGVEELREAFGEDAASIAWLEQKLSERTEKGLGLLERWQQDDGGWGWWQHDPSHPFLTAYAVFGLGLLQEAGEDVDPEMLARGRAAASRILAGTNDSDTRAWILYALAKSGPLAPAAAEAAIRLDAERGDLSPYGRALLTSVLGIAAPERATASAGLLLGLVEEGPGGTSLRWPVPRPKLYTWVGSDSEATAYAILALLEVLPAGAERDTTIERALRYLVATRRGAAWTSTKDTAAAVLAATAWLSRSSGAGALATAPSASVGFNDRVPVDVLLGPATAPARRVQAPADSIAAGTNTVRIAPLAAAPPRRRWRRAAPPRVESPQLYYSATLESVLPAVAPAPVSEGFTVRRSYHRVRLERAGEKWKRVMEPYDPASGPLVAGDRLEVHLRVEAERDWSFVLVEDPLPSGFEVEDAFGREANEWDDGSWSWWFARREVRDEKVAFFATQWVGSGEPREFVYTLRAEVPGSKHVPAASAALLYFPEIRGLSGGAELTVIPRP